MNKNKRVVFLFKLLLLAYLGLLFIMTLLPDSSNITYETTVNLVPFTSIDNFFYDIIANGFIDWEFLATKPTNPTEIVLYTFTDPQYLLITLNLSTINNYILFFNSSITVCN